MNFRDFFVPLNFDRLSLFDYLISGFWILALFMCLFILNRLFIISRRAPKYQRWKFIVDTFIRNAIFFEENVKIEESGIMQILGVDLIATPDRLRKLLPNPHFRKLIISELLSARQNVSGVAADNIKKVFYQLKLDQWTNRLLYSRSWHLNALGIQHVGIMEMDEYKSVVTKFTNSRRQLIRVEAQNTLIRLYGFDGLRFLDNATYPISEWQQIRILEQLSLFPPEKFTGIDRWLKSTNPTVVIFALKLTSVYHRFELYEAVVDCLEHDDEEVRHQAILACINLEREGTSEGLVRIYPFERDRNQLTIINALSVMASENQLSFLLSLLDSGNVKIVAASAFAISANRPHGKAALENHHHAEHYPLKDIIRHINSENL